MTDMTSPMLSRSVGRIRTIGLEGKGRKMGFTTPGGGGEIHDDLYCLIEICTAVVVKGRKETKRTGSGCYMIFQRKEIQKNIKPKGSRAEKKRREGRIKK